VVPCHVRESIHTEITCFTSTVAVSGSKQEKEERGVKDAGDRSRKRSCVDRMPVELDLFS